MVQVSRTIPDGSSSQSQASSLYEMQSHEGCAQSPSNAEHDSDADPLSFHTMQSWVG